MHRPNTLEFGTAVRVVDTEDSRIGKVGKVAGWIEAIGKYIVNFANNEFGAVKDSGSYRPTQIEVVN